MYYGKVHAAIGSSETAIKNGGKTLDKYIAYLQKDLDSQLDEANAALEDVKAAAAKANPDYHSYIALKTAQTTLEADKIANSGSQASFEIFAKMLHVNVEGFRTVMLLILSLLIELTIYQTSPKVQINRRMLYQFTAYLPADFNVNKFMDSVDKELISYDMIKTAKKSEVAMNKQDFELERAKKEAEKADLKRKAAEAKLAEKAAKKKEEAEKKAEMPIEHPKKTKKKVVHETVVETKNKSPRKQTKVAQHKTRKATAKVLAPADKKVQSEERDAELQALMDEGKGLL